MSRDIFSELMEGMDALQEHKEGKRTLRTHRVAVSKETALTPDEIKEIRRDLNLSQALFARYLHTATRTYQNWEQGLAKPNRQAALLIRIVQKSPQALSLLAAMN